MIIITAAHSIENFFLLRVTIGRRKGNNCVIILLLNWAEKGNKIGREDDDKKKNLAEKKTW